MKKYTKILAWIAVVFLTAGMALPTVGCGDSADSSASGGTERMSQTAEKETQAEEPQTEDTESEKSQQDEPKVTKPDTEKVTSAAEKIDLKDIPEYTSKAYVEINDNEPYFTEEELVTDVFELYSDLDSLGRCGVAYANICQELMPTQERGSIGQVKPSGWHTVKYDCVDGKYLYNRCHLVGYQLAAENANEKNLITGTRYLNVEGMLPFENLVADYVKETNNHVLYRVTPIFDGKNLVASGVLMEAKSVEDDGDGILFNVYCYNVQPGVTIDYATGESKGDASASAAADQKNNSSSKKQKSENEQTTTSQGTVYVTDSGEKYHQSGCRYLKDSAHEISKTEAEAEGYEPCKVCNP